MGEERQGLTKVIIHLNNGEALCGFASDPEQVSARFFLVDFSAIKPDSRTHRDENFTPSHVILIDPVCSKTA